MRKSFEGLSAVVEELFPGELLSGAFFIFINRRKDQLKVLFWDNDGLVIWFKRLEKGSFTWKWGTVSSSVQTSVEALQSQVQTLSQEVASRDEKIASLEEQLAWFFNCGFVNTLL